MPTDTLDVVETFRIPAASRPMAAADLELSVVMPCLNEERTVGTCVEKAVRTMARLGIIGEVVVVDNGSTDRSIERDRRPHLRMVRDGWWALRFILMCAPWFLFVLPGVAMLVAGLYAWSYWPGTASRTTRTARTSCSEPRSSLRLGST